MIKPSGANIAKLKYSEISVINIINGKVISGKKPSVDLDTHLLIYKNFPEINSIIHIIQFLLLLGRRQKKKYHVLAQHMQIIILIKFQ